MTYRITRTDTNDYYRFALTQDFDDQLNQASIPLPIPGNQPQDSFLFPLQAQTGQVVLNWIIHNNGADRSDNDSGTSTAPSPVITINEQKAWLKDYMFNGDLGIQYKLYGDDLPATGLNCSATSMRIKNLSGRPNEKQADITLIVGRVL